MNLDAVVFWVFITGVRDNPVTLIVMRQEEGCTENEMEVGCPGYSSQFCTSDSWANLFLSVPGVTSSKLRGRRKSVALKLYFEAVESYKESQNIKAEQ